MNPHYFIAAAYLICSLLYFGYMHWLWRDQRKLRSFLQLSQRNTGETR